MLPKTELMKLYETLLSVPGMNTPVKVHLKLPRKDFLLVSKLIERGMTEKEGDDTNVSVLDITPPETFVQLTRLTEEILQQAGLAEMNERLNSF
jgi:hypothetical protein